MIRRPPRSTLSSSSAASDVYKRQLDRISGFVCDALFSTPTFVLGLVFLLVFSGWLRVTPLFADTETGLRGFLLPVATLALASLCLLYTSPSPRDGLLSRMPSSA